MFKLNIKFNLVAATLFAFSHTLAFAATTMPINDSHTTYPFHTSYQASQASRISSSLYQTPKWAVALQALYLKPSFGGNGLGYTSFSNYGNDIPGNLVDVNGATNYMSNENPKRAWGFRLDAAYYTDANNDLDVNWAHYNHKTSGYLPTGTLFAGSAGGLYAGYISVTPTWDAINLEAGHHIDLDPRKSLRIHAGVAFANIKNKFINYPQLFINSAPLFVTTDTIKYNGFGPRFGADFDYSLCNGFSLYANTAVSLLVGTAKESVYGYHDFTFLTNTYPYSTGNYSQSHSGVVVPEVEAKLGATYDYSFKQGKLGFDLGYLWMVYLNAIVSQVGADVYSSAISASTTTNFDLSGLYFGLKWTENA